MQVPLLSTVLSVCAWAGLQEVQDVPDVAAQVEEVIAEYDAAYDAWYEKYVAAQGSAEVMKSIPEPANYGPRVMAAAARAPTSNAAFRACTWVIDNVRAGESIPTAVRHATEHLLGHPDIGELVVSVRGGNEVNNRFLAAVLEQDIPDRVAAHACYNLATGLKSELERPGVSAEESARLEARAEELFARCQSDAYARVPLRGELTIGNQARADLYEMQHLRPGKRAPEIEGEDVDGVAFRLSDYRGKVVLLDFWGDW